MTGANSEGAVAAGPFAHQRRNLAAILAGGAAGAGVVLLATRQELARVVVHAPRPLPDTVTAVTAQGVRPAIAALALAALASLAAVIATRGLLRRLTGLITIALGAGVAVSALGKVTAAAARMQWRVVVANLKAGWYDFNQAMDLPRGLSQEALRRNRDLSVPGGRATLDITPTPQSIEGRNAPAVASSTPSGVRNGV